MKSGDLVRFDYPIKGEKELYGIIVNDSSIPCHEGNEYKEVRWFGKPRVRPIRIDYLEVISESR